MRANRGGVVGRLRTLSDRIDDRRFGDDRAVTLRAERLRAFGEGLPPLMVGSMAGAVFAVLCFGGTDASTPVHVWFVAMVAVTALAIAVNRRTPTAGTSGSTRTRDVLVVRSVVMSLVVSSLGVVLVPVVDDADVGVLAALSVGYLLLGVRTVQSVPRAGLAVSLVMGAAGVATWGGLGWFVRGDTSFVAVAPVMALAALAGAYTCLDTVGQATDRFGERLRLRRTSEELRESKDVVDLLLREFEDGADAWVWECDASGTVTRVPDAIADAYPGCVGVDCRVADIARIAPRSDRTDVAERVSGIVSRRRAFHDETLRIVCPTGAVRWLSFRGKPIRADDGSFAGFRGLVADVTDAKVAEDRVRFMASHDALTGLANRITYAAHVRPWADSGQRFASLHLDLDRFKLVNDTLGHIAGDHLLVEVADRLRAAARAAHPDALAARVGGDEFMVCLPLDGDDPDALGAAALAERVVTSLSEPVLTPNGGATVGASVGVVVWPDDGTLAEVPGRADLALYRAKETGRGRWARYDASMDRRARDRIALETALRGALDRDEFHVAYQPVIDLATGEPRGVEALLRWSNADLGNVGPDAFIPVAEETGLIVGIGSWVIHKACADAMSWSRPVPVAVNVSSRQIVAGGFMETVRSALASSGLPPERLEVELTESVLVEDPEKAVAVIDRLRALGCRVVLDDFGTGYSSLSYLRTFVFDKIKVDRSFVSTLRQARADGKPSSSTLVEAIVGMARTLGMETTAEGIEEPWQADDLKGFGCEYGQGYLYSRPVPCDSIPMLGSRRPDHADGCPGARVA